MADENERGAPAEIPAEARSDFADVDAAADPSAFVRYLTRAGDAPATTRQRLSYALLDVRAGMRLLDVGCGVGDDVRALAALVGPAGEVVGLDKSETMLAAARAASEGNAHPGAFIQGDIHSLPFEDATFDGVRAERVLIHSDDPARALAEMARVARPGGVVVVTEPDLDTLIFHASQLDVVRRLTRWHCDRVRNGRVGRQLADLFTQTGLTEIRTFPTVNHTTELTSYPLTLAARAADADVLTTAEAAALTAEWRQRAADGRYLEYGVFFTVAGRVAP